MYGYMRTLHNLLVAGAFVSAALDNLAGIVLAQTASAGEEDSGSHRTKMPMDQLLDIFQLVIGLQTGRMAFVVPAAAVGIHDQAGKDSALQKKHKHLPVFHNSAQLTEPTLRTLQPHGNSAYSDVYKNVATELKLKKRQNPRQDRCKSIHNCHN